MSDIVRKPCANPSGIQSWCLLSSFKYANTHDPYVSESFLMSTATSKISPLIQRTSFPWGLGFV